MKPTHNPSLQFIKSNWQGNPLDEKGRYRNLYDKSEKGFSDLFKWQLKGNEFKKMKIGQQTNVNVLPYHQGIDKMPIGSLLWLGHATFIYKFSGATIITDPVLFNITPIKRMTPLPINTEVLININIILLSHNHRDHLDEKSMKLIARQNPNAIIYTGLGIGPLLRSWGIKNQIVEAGWYQRYPDIDDLKITFLPSKHWNRRYLTDLNTMLWGSFMVASDNKTLYFGADSGIDLHFEEIGNLFPNIDLAFLGIGAYEPNWFMQPAHTNPTEAVKCAKMLKCKLWIPMHYGTFDLSDEPIFMPKRELEKINNHNALFIDIGELIYF
jgi:L-ascorbate metabolism protein UlaG (beta-lactamase superfamily)